MNRSRLAVLVAAAVIGLAGVVVGQGQAGEAKDFVQRFYDWYAPIAQRNNNNPPSWSEAVKSRRDDFSAELIDLLGKDLSAKEKCDDNVGIEADPFTDALLASDRYVAGKVSGKGKTFKVGVFAGDAQDEEDVLPTVFAVVEWQDKKFRFVNFEYPIEKTDLVGMIKAKQRKCEHPRN